MPTSCNSAMVRRAMPRATARTMIRSQASQPRRSKRLASLMLRVCRKISMAQASKRLLQRLNPSAQGTAAISVAPLTGSSSRGTWASIIVRHCQRSRCRQRRCSHACTWHGCPLARRTAHPRIPRAPPPPRAPHTLPCSPLAKARLCPTTLPMLSCPSAFLHTLLLTAHHTEKVEWPTKLMHLAPQAVTPTLVCFKP